MRLGAKTFLTTPVWGKLRQQYANLTDYGVLFKEGEKELRSLIATLWDAR
jgi:hypothetical protein